MDRNQKRRGPSELTVITKAKELSLYIFRVTDSSPKKFRFTFVTKLQSASLEVIENLYRANMIHVTDGLDYDRIERRKHYQREAYVSLRLLGYLSQLARETGCILPKQYEQISDGVTQTLKLLVAWGNSDRKRYRG